jgi:hypothetical protein
MYFVELPPLCLTSLITPKSTFFPGQDSSGEWLSFERDTWSQIGHLGTRISTRMKYHQKRHTINIHGPIWELHQGRARVYNYPCGRELKIKLEKRNTTPY